jgi:hypothetical protein
MTRIAQANSSSSSRHSANAIRSVSRCLAAIALADHRGQPPETIIKRNWPDDTSALLLTRAAVWAIVPTPRLFAAVHSVAHGRLCCRSLRL